MNIKIVLKTKSVILLCLLAMASVYGAKAPNKDFAVCTCPFTEELSRRFPDADSVITAKDGYIIRYSRASEKNPIVPMAIFNDIVPWSMQLRYPKGKGNYYVVCGISKDENPLDHIDQKHFGVVLSGDGSIVVDEEEKTLISLPEMIEYLRTYVKNAKESKADTVKSKFAELLSNVLPKDQSDISEILSKDHIIRFGFLELFASIFGTEIFIQINKIGSIKYEILEFVRLNLKQDCTLKVAYEFEAKDDDGDTIINLKSMYPVNRKKIEGIQHKLRSSWYDTLWYIISFTRKIYPINTSKRSILSARENAKNVLWTFLDNQLRFDMGMFYEDCTKNDVERYMYNLCTIMAAKDHSDFPALFNKIKKNEETKKRIQKATIEIILYDSSAVFSHNEIKFLKNFFYGNTELLLCLLLVGKNPNLVNEACKKLVQDSLEFIMPAQALNAFDVYDQFENNIISQIRRYNQKIKEGSDTEVIKNASFYGQLINIIYVKVIEEGNLLQNAIELLFKRFGPISAKDINEPMFYENFLKPLLQRNIKPISLENIGEWKFVDKFRKGLFSICCYPKATPERKKALENFHTELFEELPIQPDKVTPRVIGGIVPRLYNIVSELQTLIEKKDFYKSFIHLLLMNHVISYRFPEHTFFPKLNQNILDSINKEAKHIPYSFYYYFTWTFMLKDWLNGREELKNNYLKLVNASTIVDGHENRFLKMLANLLTDFVNDNIIDLQERVQEVRSYLIPKATFCQRKKRRLHH